MDIKTKEYQKRIFILAIIVIIACVLYCGYYFYSLPESPIAKQLIEGFATKIFPILFVFGLGSIAFNYITTYLDKARNINTDNRVVYNYYNSPNDKQDSHIEINEEQKEELISLLKEKLIAATNSDLLSELKSQFSIEFQLDSFFQEINKIYENSHERLDKEIQSLEGRSNTNLALGFVISLTGLIFLGGFLLWNEEPTKELLPFIFHYLPRLALFLFIELFAYFFLRLYKTSLEEIKYFQNELTNLESKHIALITAFKQNDTEIIKSVINSLANTERNRIINKDQTTIELEAIRIEKQSTVDMGKLFTDLVSSIVPNKEK